MTDFIIPLWLMASIFLFVALAYSSVGLGGGSSYTALMVVLGFNSLSIPILSLTFNLIVTSIGCYYFVKQGHLRVRLILPFIIVSLPMAWLGGALQVPEALFKWLLMISLMVIVYRIYAWKKTAIRIQFTPTQVILLSIGVGAMLGLLAGIIGIGGGIFLVPLILVLGLGSVKQAAACGAVFVWLNSLVGLISRFQYNYIELSNYLPLIVTVMVGGVIGSAIGSSKISSQGMEKVLGGVVVIAIFFLGRSLLLG